MEKNTINSQKRISKRAKKSFCVLSHFRCLGIFSKARFKSYLYFVVAIRIYQNVFVNKATFWNDNRRVGKTRTRRVPNRSTFYPYAVGEEQRSSLDQLPKQSQVIGASEGFWQVCINFLWDVKLFKRKFHKIFWWIHIWNDKSNRIFWIKQNW